MAYDRRAEEPELPQPAGAMLDYRRELGKVFVPLDEAHDFVILDPDRAAALRAWTAALIPARGERPAADEVGAAEYIDATAFQAPRIRAALLAAIDALDGEARQLHRTTFAGCTQEEQTRLLRALETSRWRDVFAMVRELTYEAYYAHPRVLAILADETGWQSEAAFSGGTLEPFDERLLERMRPIAPHYRHVSKGEGDGH
jgi:hypothetical protein